MYKSFLVFLCIIGGYGREEDGVGTAERKAAWEVCQNSLILKKITKP